MISLPAELVDVVPVHGMTVLDGIASVVSSRIRKRNIDRRPRGPEGERGADGEGSGAAPAPAEGDEGAPSPPPAGHLVELIADAAEAATAQPQPAPGVLARRSLRITLNGMSRQAHQLTARGGAGWEDKTQLLFVTPDGDFDRAQLIETDHAITVGVEPARAARVELHLVHAALDRA